jgi:hypothetical protein
VDVARLEPEHHWICPRCTHTAVTHDPRPHTPLHPCAGLGGLMHPLIPEGTTAKVEIQTWGDYVGAEAVQTDGDGRPVTAVITTTDDAQHATVLPPALKQSFAPIKFH